MRQPEDGAGADERLGEALPIEGAPAVWHDEPPPDDYHVEVADVDPTDEGASDAPAPLFADPVTLRPARRTGGIRTPRPFAATAPIVEPPVTDTDRSDPFADADSRPMGRPMYGSGRPLPRVGTEALGRCVRLTRYGAFVDFSGHRGLIHISQLRPGLRVERVEDVITIGDEVVVRVIAVDPQARHVNLTYVCPAPLSPSTVDTASPTVISPSAPPRTMANDATPTLPPTMPDSSTSAESAMAAANATVASPPDDAATPDTVRETVRVATGRPSVESRAPSPAQPVPPIAPTPTPVRRREIVGYVPGARVRTEASAASQPVMPGATPPSRPTTTPKAPEVARSGSRAMRRELDDPNHPMARFLAMSPDLGATARPARPASRTAPSSAPIDPEPEVAPEPPRMVPATRLVHADEPEPELPVSDTPATIDALAARFGSKPALSTRGARPTQTSRSQAAREAQARMLEQLRRQG